MATGVDRRARARRVYVARGIGRPLWLGEGRDGVFFASTELALEVVEQYCAAAAAQARASRGHAASRLRDGEIVRRERFRPDLEYVEDDPLPAVRAPARARVLPARLAALAAAL